MIPDRLLGLKREPELEDSGLEEEVEEAVVTEETAEASEDEGR